MSSTGATGYRDTLRRVVTAWKDMFGAMLGGAFSKLVGDPAGNFIVVHDGASLARELKLHRMDGISSLLLDAAFTHGKTCGELVPDLVVLACDLVIDALSLIDAGLSPRVVLAGYDVAGRALLDRLAPLSFPAVIPDQDTIARRVEARLARELGSSVSRHLGGLVAGWLHRCGHVGFPAGGIHLMRCSKDPVAITCTETLDVVLAPGGRIRDSYLVHGVAIEQEPFSWHSRGEEYVRAGSRGARVVIVSGELHFEKRKHEWIEFSLGTPAAIKAMNGYWEQSWETAASRLVDAGVSIVLSERGIDDALVSSFHSRQPGGLVFCRVPREKLDRLARASGASIVPRLSLFQPADAGVVSRVDFLERRGEHVFLFTCAGQHDTLVLRGGSHEVCQGVEEILRVVIAGELGRWQGIVPGYPAVLARAVAGASNTIQGLPAGKTMLAALAFMHAVERLHERYLTSAGLDPLDPGQQVPNWDTGLRGLQAMIDTARAVTSKLVRVDGVIQCRNKLS